MSLSQHFEIAIEGIIWKQFIDAFQKHLVLESRNSDLRQVEFYVIDIENGDLLNHILPQEETWWIGIQDVVDGKIIVHAYENEQSPIQKGITVYEALTGEILWENSDIFFYQKEEKTIWVTNEEQAFLKLDLKTGFLVKEQDTMPTIMLNDFQLIDIPVHYSEDNSHFLTISTYLKQLQGIQAVKIIEYWESINRIVISYYICDENQKLENYLLVLSTKGEILFQDCLDMQLTGIGMDTFYIYQNKLFFIQEKKKIVCINL